jgi:maltoporin
LEQKIETEKENREKTKEVTISPKELAPEASQGVVPGRSDQVGAKYQGQLPSGPTYDFLRDADTKIAKLQEQLNSFEFHGYFRSGYGLNSVGGQ